MASDEQDQRDLEKLYATRLRDRRLSKTKRIKGIESRPKRINELLHTHFQGDGIATRKIEENRALMAWPEFVGEAAARISKAVRIRGDKLVVEVTNALWMQEFIFLKQDLIRKYYQQFPSLRIRDIYFTRR